MRVWRPNSLISLMTTGRRSFVYIVYHIRAVRPMSEHVVVIVHIDRLTRFRKPLPFDGVHVAATATYRSSMVLVVRRNLHTYM